MATTLIIEEIPGSITTLELDSYFAPLKGYLSAQVMTYRRGRSTIFNVLFEFADATAAEAALTSCQSIQIDHQTYQLQCLDTEKHIHRDIIFGETRYPVRPGNESNAMTDTLGTCLICCEKIPLEEYCKPCRYCRRAQCSNCLKTQFENALKDHERMPVACCTRVMHYDAVQGIISREVMEKYKLRFDEMATQNPLYCPVPRCSRFIPPRMIQPINNRTSCPDCATLICLGCKAVADSNHQCIKSSETPEAMILKTFKYKMCPSCGAGVARMFGCSHMRCTCGAQWCWRCQKQILICNRDNCDEDERISDEEYENEHDEPPPQPGAAPTHLSSHEETGNEETSAPDGSTPAQAPTDAARTAPEAIAVESQADTTNVETVAEPYTASEVRPAYAHTLNSNAHVGSTSESTETGAAADEDATTIESSAAGSNNVETRPPTHSDVKIVNLDNPRGRDWRSVAFYFGEEPILTMWSAWGCQHRFHTIWVALVDWGRIKTPAEAASNHTSSTICAAECMRCFKYAMYAVPKAKHERNSSEMSTSDEGDANKAAAEDSEQVHESDQEEPHVDNVAAEDDTIENKELNATTEIKKQGTRKLRHCLHYCRKCGIVVCTACRG